MAGGCATEGNGGHGIFGLQRGLPQQTANVRGGAQAGVGNVEFACVGPDVVFEIAVSVGLHLRLGDECHRHVVDHAQKLKIFQRLVVEFSVQGGCGRHANVKDQQGMTVRRRLGHFGGANGAARACGVFDHEVATWQVLAHGFSQIARHTVGRAACGERHDNRDRFGARKILGIRRQCKSSRQGQSHPLFHWELLIVKRPILRASDGLNVAEIT